MNKQELFDKVYGTLIKQGCRAYSMEYHACEYKDSEGNKCAVGHLLPEGHEAFFSGSSVAGILSKWPDLKEHFGVEDDADIHFLGRLQSAHDNASHDNVDGEDFVGDFRDNMVRIAQKYKLEMP